MDEAKDIIDSFFACISNRLQLGIANLDLRVNRNFGVINGEVIEIDIGSFAKTSCLSSEPNERSIELKKWIHLHKPELNDYLEKKFCEKSNF